MIMFFVFGSPRSGTTLLSSSLNLHPDIVVPEETDLIIPLAFLFDRIEDPQLGKRLMEQLIVSSKAFPSSIGRYLSRDDVTSCIQDAKYSPASILAALYDLVARKAAKRLAGDKSPNDLGFLRILVKAGVLDGPVPIIHIVRDVRDVVLSLQKVGWVPDIETYFPRFWCYSNLYLHNLYKTQPQRYLLVHFEHMVQEPETVFREITAFLGVPFLSSLLDHALRVAPGQRLPPHHESLRRPFMPDKALAWKQEMTDDLQKLCERQSQEALAVFGYV
jgi:hypothetical protein